jgi:hypothetical protein
MKPIDVRNLKPGTRIQRASDGVVCFIRRAPMDRFGRRTVWLFRVDNPNQTYHLLEESVLRNWYEI